MLSPMTETSKRTRYDSNSTLPSVTIKFAGDSGDGIQLTGGQFARLSNEMHNVVVTFSSFPAEIRPPAGTLAGVSSYQLQIGDDTVYTPGDEIDVLVALNPAALKANISSVRENGVIILNKDAFTAANLEKAQYDSDPVAELKSHQVFSLELTKLNKSALEKSSLSPKLKDRCKNFFVLGFIAWLFDRKPDYIMNFIQQKFAKNPDVLEANTMALEAGFNYGENTEKFIAPFYVARSKKAKQEGKFTSGNQAIVQGLVTACRTMNKNLFLGGYPITPASDILHECAKHEEKDIVTFQAEDEMAAIGAAIGASYAGSIGACCTSGPGMALKQEFLNLAMITELPLVVVDVQRAGPSTGLPTKMEQSDLFLAMYGRNGESPLVVLAPYSPSDCYHIAQEAARFATKYMVPVVILSDLYLANSSEPLADAKRKYKFEPSTAGSPEHFKPYQRNEKTLARPWAIPGMQGFEHIIGGLEKDSLSGTVSYDPENHEKMCLLRANKVQRIEQDIEELKVTGNETGDLLIVGWGSTYGPIIAATERLLQKGKKVACVHLRHLNPFPRNFEQILRNYKQVAVVENNLGQLLPLIRSEFLIDAKGIQKIQGTPFLVNEIETRTLAMIG